jgi:UPF0176 protein
MASLFERARSWVMSMVKGRVQIISFYEFREMPVAVLPELRGALKDLFRELHLKGTIILAAEGFNGMASGAFSNIEMFISRAGKIFGSSLEVKSSFHDSDPFRRIDVKIKPEIVTLKEPVDQSLGDGTHVTASEWNQLISDPDTLVLDTRNDYEFSVGTFQGAVNPGIEKFSELPEYVSQNLDPVRHKRIAMFCTGGIRCEKFAPYLKMAGFPEVYQLSGGILRYLETIPEQESLWQGECFVFDDRVSVDSKLEKGLSDDPSQDRARSLPRK